MRGLILLTAVLAAGCASTYEVPRLRAPLEWTGRAGIQPVAETLEVFEGEHARDSVLLRWGVEHVRTGRLAQDAVYGHPDREQFTLPAGTPVYAMQFSMQQVTTYGGAETARRDLNAGNNPIEWCAVPASGPTVCAFWESPEQALYIDAPRGMPLIASIRSPVGRPGVVPVVTEEPVDFATPLMMEVRVGRVRERDVQLATQITDGTASQSVPGGGLSPLLRWDSNGQARAFYFGGELQLEARPSERRAVGALAMSVVTPLLDPSSEEARASQMRNDPQMAVMLQVLEMLREREAQRAAGKPEAAVEEEGGDAAQEPEPGL